MPQHYQVPDLREMLTQLRELYEISPYVAYRATRLLEENLKHLLYTNRPPSKKTVSRVLIWWHERRGRDQKLLELYWRYYSSGEELARKIKWLYPEDREL